MVLVATNMATSIRLILSTRIQTTCCKWPYISPLSCRLMSQYPPSYVDAVVGDKLVEEEKLDLLKDKQFIPIKAALSNQNESLFYDPIVAKFVNIMMRHGRKEVARNVLLKTFENVKKIQLKKYNQTESLEEKKKIVCDPVKILHAAMMNVTPVIGVRSTKRGGVIYQVPVPLPEHRAKFMAMKWLWLAGTERDKKILFPDHMAKEMIDASNNVGRAVKKKQDLHKLCEANRAYAHYV